MADLMARRSADPAWKELRPGEHVVQFYESDAFLLDAVADFVGAGLRAGEACLVVATAPHREGLEARLRAEGLDPDAARRTEGGPPAGGRYVPLDGAEMLARIMTGGMPDRERFAAVIGGAVATARTGEPPPGGGERRPLRVFGEMVALLAGAGNHRAAVRLEALWNELQARDPFTLYCAYPMDELEGEAMAGLLEEVCDAHSRVVPAESYTALATPDERGRAVALLQQKARWLGAEIAERRRVEGRLRDALAAERAARKEVEDALRLRDEFLSVAAHELKTPVASLSGYAQLVLRRLARGQRLEPERVKQALRAVTAQAAKLARLIDQLLDVTRLDAGRLTLERQPTDLGLMVEQVVAGLQPWSDRHPLAVAVRAPVEAEVDPLRLEQVLVNLLDNAIKFSPDGGPIDVVLDVEHSVGPDAGPAGPGRGVAELSVRDRGLGIPPERRGRIFERFYQAHEDGYRSGMGLGLYVSRQIVGLHGGEIRAEFPPDGGTRFVVRLPLG